MEVLTEDLKLCEVFSEVNWKILGEGKVDGGKTTLIVQANRVQYGNKPNANNRIYPTRLLARETAKLQAQIKMRALTGELDHPPELHTSLKNVSHLITKLWMEGDEQRAIFEILPTPNGNIARDLYESKVAIGVSSRGAGRAEQDGEYFRISEDFVMKTYDLVSDPSTYGAYFTKLNESQIIRPSKKIVEVNSGNMDLILSGEFSYDGGM